MPPDALVAASFLPDSPLRDPADRILAATARG
jgi:PIN domain nuclease of toxin-antitoxin system